MTKKSMFWGGSLLVAGGLASCFLLAGAVPRTQFPAGPPIAVVGHAGSGFFTPINPFNPLPPSSLAGLRQALARGADGVEIDVRLSRDSVPFVYHDPQLNTMSGGQGCVSQYTAAELEKLAYRGGFVYDLFHDEQLMRLQTVLAALPTGANSPLIHLDLHEDDVCAGEGDSSRSPALARSPGPPVAHGPHSTRAAANLIDEQRNAGRFAAAATGGSFGPGNYP